MKQQQKNYCERFSLKITNKSCNNGLKYCKFTRTKNKGKHVMKKIILKGNITTRSSEYKHKNTGTSCMPFCTPHLQC